ncbi:phosphatidate cytidylyltransferase [Minwuia thermotolerans]|uniref:Phosphatidate cytidylyltransferase n=1 Tax=Minwuia thermotolerans TaxID=2056226 RepID=A0A2M9G580_9PROT|nr:phosphatidate cytidylyltransferase [Minwuia thermotolerans]PJK30873.1 phosphatidate cytidylyltransferase [Minwuia thermotolerans]
MEVGVSTGVLGAMAVIILALVVGTLVRLTQMHRLSERTARKLGLRLRTWWLIAFVLVLLILAGVPATVGFFCVVSLLALREYWRLVPERAEYGGLIWWAYGAAVLQYIWVYSGLFDLLMIFIPILTFLLLTLRVVILQRPDGFVHMVGTLQWGLMIFVFCLSHVAFLLTLPPETNPVGGAVGWFIYLVVLTEFNDMAQAWLGRPLGRHKIIPQISPGKSWEGLAGGLLCTTVAAMLLAPFLTPLAGPSSSTPDGLALSSFLSPLAAGAGLLIGISGFCGDIAVSAVKRDARVKDSGTMLPGHGGILDRIDSLTFAAPLFFHYVYFIYR